MQASISIANGTGAAFRTAVNNALQAILNNNSGTTEPATKYPYMFWADTSTVPAILKIRKGTNDGWIAVGTLSDSGVTFFASDSLKLGGQLPAYYATAIQGTKADNALPAASYTASDVLTKLLTVDTNTSGLNAHTLQGFSKQDIVANIYPIGSIYISTVDTNPATLFGIGTWARTGGGRMLIDASETYTAGATGGAETHTLTVSEIPAHSHTMPSTAAWDYRAGPSQTTYMSNNIPSETSSVGGGQPHNNMPPYLAVYIWKRTA